MKRVGKTSSYQVVSNLCKRCGCRHYETILKDSAVFLCLGADSIQIYFFESPVFSLKCAPLYEIYPDSFYTVRDPSYAVQCRYNVIYYDIIPWVYIVLSTTKAKAAVVNWFTIPWVDNRFTKAAVDNGLTIDAGDNLIKIADDAEQAEQAIAYLAYFILVIDDAKTNILKNFYQTNQFTTNFFKNLIVNKVIQTYINWKIAQMLIIVEDAVVYKINYAVFAKKVDDANYPEINFLMILHTIAVINVAAAKKFSAAETKFAYPTNLTGQIKAIVNQNSKKHQKQRVADSLIIYSVSVDSAALLQRILTSENDAIEQGLRKGAINPCESYVVSQNRVKNFYFSHKCYVVSQDRVKYVSFQYIVYVIGLKNAGARGGDING